MAGTKQHYLWQLLQRGFSWRENNDDHIWVYENGVAPRRTVTRKFGQVPRFYGPQGSKADENITNFENRTHGFIQDARIMEHGQSVDRDIAAILVAHLEMRSLFLRDEMSRLGERVARIVRDSMQDPRRYRKMISSYIENHPEILDAELEKESIDPSLRPAIKELILTSKSKMIEHISYEAVEFSRLYYEGMLSRMAETASEAHNNALLADFSEAGRAELHRSLEYSVIRSSQADFILPDTYMTFFADGKCTPISDKDQRVEAVVVPLSTDVAIIGKRNSTFEREMKTIRRALASCAYKAFISPHHRVDLEMLSQRISRNARLLTESEIQSAVRFDTLLKI